MNNNLTELSQLRNNLDFASIAQFFHTFQSAFRPWPTTEQDIGYARHEVPNEYVFETEDLERLLLEASERIRFEELLVKMLRLASHNRFINSSNWQLHFSKELGKREFEESNPFIPKPSDQSEQPQDLLNYFTLPLDTRVHLLHLLCEWQLDDPEKFREHLDSEQDSVQWRVDPIGFDKKGSTFWLFDDNRLYKETPKPTLAKKNNKRKKRITVSSRKSSRRSTRNTKEDSIEEMEEAEESEEEEWKPWKLVCLTRFDWEQFPAKFKDSKNTDEQRFYRLLTEDLLPKVLPVLEEHEKELLKQQAIIHRKRSSRIMIRELEALAVDPNVVLGPRTSSRIEKRVSEREQEEKEHQVRAREERLLERERRIMEREYRALAREKKESTIPVEPMSFDESDSVKTKPEPVPETSQEVKPKRKYTKRPKFDEFGNPIPRKVKLDKDGNPIPLKKRGRKPKNRNLEEENWMFDCICGVKGENVDDGEPMIACEKCSIWQHIGCLQKSGIIEKDKKLDNLVFVCQRCDNGSNQEDVNIDDQATLGDYNESVSVQLPAIQSAWQHQASCIRENNQSLNQANIPLNSVMPQPHQQTSKDQSQELLTNETKPILNQDIPQSTVRSEQSSILVIPAYESSLRSEPTIINTVQEFPIRSEPTLITPSHESSIRSEPQHNTTKESSIRSVLPQ